MSLIVITIVFKYFDYSILIASDKKSVIHMMSSTFQVCSLKCIGDANVNVHACTV
jgi:hypothetical protein